MADRHTVQPTRSVELYIPWNNSWVSLPSLPDFPDDGIVCKMTFTHIMLIDLSGRGNSLYLMGGVDMVWSPVTEYITAAVFELVFNSASHSYYWDSALTQHMGE